MDNTEAPLLPLPAEIADRIAEVALRIAKDEGYRIRASEDLLKLAEQLRGDSVVPTTQPSGATLEPGARSPVDLSFDEWYARQRHQLTNEQVCRLIWTRGWGAAARQFGEAYQREEARADAAEQRAEEAAQWISVDERLPEPDTGEVLVWLTGGRCAFDEWHTHHEDPTGLGGQTMDMGLMWRDYEFEDITHWMKLPAPPGASAERSSEGEQT